MNRQQPPLGDHQIGQPEQAEQLRVVLGQAAVACLSVAKQVLDCVERVLELGANARLDLLGLLNHLAQWAVAEVLALARLHRDVRLRALDLFALGNLTVAGITKGVSLFALNKLARQCLVIDAGRGAELRVQDARLGVHADVGLYAAGTLIPILRLVHIAITLTTGVFGQARRRNDGGVQEGAAAQEQNLFGKVGMDNSRQRLGRVVGNEQTWNLQPRGGIGHRISSLIVAYKFAQPLGVVDSILKRFVSRALPLLKQIRAQHLYHPHRLPSDTTTGLIQRRDDCNRTLPLHRPLHVGAKVLAMG